MDAHQLDNELLEIIFLKQLGKCFDCFDESIASKYKEEMKLFLEFSLWFKTRARFKTYTRDGDDERDVFRRERNRPIRELKRAAKMDAFAVRFSV